MQATKLLASQVTMLLVVLSNSNHNITVASMRNQRKIDSLSEWLMALNSFNYTHPQRMKYGMDNIADSRHVAHYMLYIAPEIEHTHFKSKRISC